MAKGMRLIDPLREKLPGDAAAAEACLGRIEDALVGEPRLAGLGVLRGRYEMRMGRCRKALEAFRLRRTGLPFVVPCR